jgi:hypothetical protein
VQLLLEILEILLFSYVEKKKDVNAKRNL